MKIIHKKFTFSDYEQRSIAYVNDKKGGKKTDGIRLATRKELMQHINSAMYNESLHISDSCPMDLDHIEEDLQ